MRVRSLFRMQSSMNVDEWQQRLVFSACLEVDDDESDDADEVDK